MRTGLKTLYRKTKKFVRHPDLLFGGHSSFPERGTSKLRFNLKLYSLVNELSEWKLKEKIGWFHSTPHPAVVKVWEKLLKYNPNNLGNWSIGGRKSFGGTRMIERELIKAMVDLVGGRTGEWEGYVTSGATEANIFSARVGGKKNKKKLKKKKERFLCV